MILKSVDSEMFEQAQFILREGKTFTAKRDMAKEAERIISENISGGTPQNGKRKRRSAWLPFLAGMILSAAAMIPLFFLLK